MFMWIIYAFASAFFAGVTSILAKCGIRKTDSNVATAIRTIVVLLFSWVMVFLVGSQATLSKLTGESLLYLVLSGLATGASWLCYFKALQLGDVNKVVPVDKSSTVLTILLAFFLLHEEITWQKAVSVAAIAAGTYLMIRQCSEIRQGVVSVCGAFRCVCKPHCNPRQARNRRGRIESRHGTPHRRSPHHGMGCCVRNGEWARRKKSAQK